MFSPGVYKTIRLLFTWVLLLTAVRLVAQPTPKAGVNTSSPQATLDVNGEIKIGDAVNTPQAGMVRWNPATNDFEGYNGTQWLSLTKSNAATGQWGQAVTSVVENTKLVASDGAASDQFARSVSISGDYALIGVERDTIDGNQWQGSAYIYIRSGDVWLQQQKLTASDGVAFDFFGSSVSISGDYAIVGARGDDILSSSSQGSAYIFVRNGTVWSQQQKITASDGSSNDVFGSSVSISGDNVIVGADGDAIGANTGQGSAYIFVRNGTSWSQQAKLIASDGAVNDYFGYSVSISGDYALVGSYGDDISSLSDRGSAYIFFRTGTSWAQQQKLTASDGAQNDQFGFAVSISGDYAVVGSPKATVATSLLQGTAYIFFRSGTSWTLQQKLIASDGSTIDEFGSSVSISGDNLLIGSYRDQIGGEESQGSAYIFTRSNTVWNQQSKLIASDGSRTDGLGISVGISGNYLIIGASGDNVNNNTRQGSAYIFKRN